LLPAAFIYREDQLLSMANVYNTLDETNEGEEGYRGYSVIPAEKV
jgi:hypothetical protein